MVVRTAHPISLRDVVYVATDHKPHVSLLSSNKNLDGPSPRIQPFRMRLMQCMYTTAHVPGKSLITADALSRAPQELPLTEAEDILKYEVTAQATLFVHGCVTCNIEASGRDQS